MNPGVDWETRKNQIQQVINQIMKQIEAMKISQGVQIDTTFNQFMGIIQELVAKVDQKEMEIRNLRQIVEGQGH